MCIYICMYIYVYIHRKQISHDRDHDGAWGQQDHPNSAASQVTSIVIFYYMSDRFRSGFLFHSLPYPYLPLTLDIPLPYTYDII
jgi:hypothetical protein